MKKNNNFIALLLIFFFISISSYSQDNKKEEPKSEEKKSEQDTNILRTHKRLPMLNNFKFMPSDVVSDPFINTDFTATVGTGTAFDLNAYIRNFKGNVFDTVSGNLTYVAGGVQFQYAFNDWISVKAGYRGGGRLGTNTYTILTSGISYATSTELQGKVLIWQNDKMTVSGSLDFAYREISAYDFYDYIKKAIENGPDSSAENSLLQTDCITNSFINGNWAYAPANWIGFLGVLGFGLGEEFRGSTRGNLRLGALASVDFQNVKGIKFPVGIALSVKYNSFSETSENVRNIITYGFGIGYTGHKDFDIIIESIYQSLNSPVRPEDRIDFIQTFAKVKYYF